MNLSRREILAAGAALPVAGHAALAAAAPPSDESNWAGIAAQYDIDRGIIPLENGNWGIMSRPVLKAYEKQVERVNRENSFLIRRAMIPEAQAIHASAAAYMGVDADEMAFTRNATEALKALITGYNRLKPGDAVLYSDLDYDSMSSAMESLKSKRGVDVIKISIPEPVTYQRLIDTYSQALETHANVRMMLITHLSHRTGLMPPVRDIIAMARTKNVDVIVDAAHSWGQDDFRVSDLGADFVGLNLHKWIGAPLGVGAMVIAKGRIEAIDRDPGDWDTNTPGVHSRVHTGTSDFAAMLTLPAALDFHASIPPAARAARLRALRARWAEQLRGMKGLEILTPDDDRLHCGITSFRISGLTSVEENKAVAAALLEKYNIFTVHRTDVAKGACVRVTPALFNTMGDVDALVAALKELVPAMARV